MQVGARSSELADREVLLSKTFVELADTLVDEFDIIDLLTMLADRCVALLGADAAGILVTDHDDTLHLVAASSAEVRLLELFQLQNDEGPCLDCFSTGQPVTADLRTSQRWPKLVSGAIAAGFTTVHALPMRLRDRTIGTLNIFGGDGALISQGDQEVAQALADAATIAILHEQAAREAKVVTGQLQTALNSRIAIEQAKGVLAERAQVSMDEAFSRLRRYARSRNRRLGLVASSVVAGTLADDAMAELTAVSGDDPTRRP